MAIYTVKTAQNIFDIATDIYGSIEGIFDLLISNTWLDMTTQLESGMQLTYHENLVLNKNVIKALKVNNINMANAARSVVAPSIDFVDCDIIFRCFDTPKEIKFNVKGSGQIKIEWGDNSNIQTFNLTSGGVAISHYFNTDEPEQVVRVKCANDVKFNELEVIAANYQILLIHPVYIAKYISKQCTVDSIGLSLAKPIDSTKTVEIVL